MKNEQEKTGRTEIIGCCEKMSQVMDADHPEHDLFLNCIHGDRSHCPFCGEEMQKTLDKIVQESSIPLFSEKDAETMDEIGCPDCVLEEPPEIDWKNVGKHWGDLQHGFCPDCGALDRILVTNNAELGVCDTHKVVWVNSSYGYPITTEAEEKEKLKSIEGYSDGTEEIGKVLEVIHGVIERLSSAEDETIA